MITFDEYVTASGKYPERLKDFPNELKDNVEKLLKVVNSFLSDVGVTRVAVLSGYRPAAVNAAIGGAKKSLHMQCLAIDLEDKDGKLDELFKTRSDELRKYSLFLESPDHTVHWSHLDLGNRTDRPSRIFMP